MTDSVVTCDSIASSVASPCSSGATSATVLHPLCVYSHVISVSNVSRHMTFAHVMHNCNNNNSNNNNNNNNNNHTTKMTQT